MILHISIIKQSVIFYLIFVYKCDLCYCDYLYSNVPSIPSAPILPEILINRNIPQVVNFGQGYVYPIPQNPLLPPTLLPPLQDEIPLNDYLPPPDNSILPSSSEIPPPQNDYLPPANDAQPPSSAYGVPASKSSIVKAVTMSCLDSSQQRFFKATIQSPDFIHRTPVFPKMNAGCNLNQQSLDTITIHLDGVKVGDCGVHYCSDKKLCLNLRIPVVKGLKLPEDSVISLQCIPQSSVVSAIKTLAINPQVVQGRVRSLPGTIATGGAQRNFEPHIAVYRRGNGFEYNQLVESGSSVLLGEELMLRTSIRESDGWKFSKMGSVTIQQGIKRNNARKSVTLVDNSGCRVEEMKSICPENPKQLNNFVIAVPFRAFLFQDASESDEMLLSVRLYACMNYEDCQAKHCEEKVVRAAGHTSNKRLTRSINGTQIDENLEVIAAYHNGTSTKGKQSMQDYESHLDFRVVMPNTAFNAIGKQSRSDSNIFNWYIIVCALLFVAIFGLTILNIAIYWHSQSRTAAKILM